MDDCNITNDLVDYSIGGDIDTDLFVGELIIVGGGWNHRVGKNEIVIKDAVTRKLIPDSISECAIFLNSSTCMSDAATLAIGNAIGINGEKSLIVSTAKEKLNCDSERCVLEKMAPVIGDDVVDHEINTHFKIQGPTDSKLLTNINIDNTLTQWSRAYPDFYNYHFHMLNYASYSYRDGKVYNKPDTLATLLFDDLYYDRMNVGRPYTRVGCVINTDTYQGPGQHWMALYAQARGTDWTVEFFNSSGNSPAPEWVNWMEKTRVIMENIIAHDKLNAKVRVVRASPIRHQNSRSECGLYSLFYIWARLNNVPVEYFAANHIPDQLMFEFRQHLFDDPGKPKIDKFDWGKYKATTKIQWG